MDFITQNLLGAVAGQAATTRRLGRWAVLPGLLGGAVPDFDVLLRPWADPALPFELHRHFTHSVVFIPVGAALAMLPLLPFRPFRRDLGATALSALAGCATHGLLDNLTSYGTHLWWPFTGARTAWDAMSIVDPIFSVLLLLGLVASLALGKARPAVAAFALCAAYVALGFVQHARALGAQERLAERRGHVIERGRATPTLGNMIVWRSVYESEGRLYADAVHVAPLGAVRVREGTSVPRLGREDVPEHARVREVFDGLDEFATGFVAVDDRGAGGAFTVGDMRFSLRTDGFEPLWGILVDPEADEPVRWVSMRHGHDGDLGDLLAALWADIVAPETSFGE